jgi:hypothetical protein
MRSVMLCFLVAFVSMGCGDEKKAAQRSAERNSVRETAEAKPAAVVESADDKVKPLPGAQASMRKIIHTATLSLVVEHFDPVPEKVAALVDRLGAYVARSQITGTAGSLRRGQWTVRVPVERYEAFLLAAGKLGEVHSVNSDSQDVTEEYYDVDARIRNKKQEETRLNDLLAKAAGRLEEVLTLEREITRVRGEVEQLEGRLHVLESVTAMSTVNLEISEIKEFVPGEPVAYGARVRRAWDDSLADLISVGQAVSVFLVMASPWIAVFLPILLVVVIVLRVKRRRA